MNKHKTKKDIVKLFAAIIMMLVANTAYPQQQIIQIASRANSYCNSTCTQLDVPELNNNRIAVVIATPVIENGYVYPHPIGVHYINDKWSIINLDQASMPPGSKFTVQYFSKPDPDHQFVHIVNSENLTNNNTRSFIDHAGLNNNPEAQFQFISNGSGNGNNMYNIRIQYDSAAGKWYMYSIKKRSLDYNIAFNIILASKGNATVKPDVVQVKEGVKKDAKFSDSTKIIPSTKPNTEPVQPLVVLPAIIQGTPDNSLYGFVDMHTHPVSQLGFGEQLFYGDNDGDANVALGSCTCYHNFVALNCSQQNVYRNQMVDKIDEKFHLAKHNKVAAFPDFKEWPKYNSILHQQMWYEWIRRAKEGGLSVMVALAVNNHCIADAAETGGANDDLASMNKQLIAMKELFSRHPDFCEIAYTSADLRRIVKSGNLAVILGIEIDNIGNFYNPADHKGASYDPYPGEIKIKAEIDRLFVMGVRYIFPIHVTNNLFGGAAIYDDQFNIANKYNTGSAFATEVVSSAEGISFKLRSPFTQMRQDLIGGILMGVTGPILPSSIMPDVESNYPAYLPSPQPGEGNRNSLSLTSEGLTAIKYMMQKGMMIDIDHMSEKAVNSAFALATGFNYPLNSGHNGFRGANANLLGIGADNENAKTEAQVKKIYSLGGMMGIGHGGHSTFYVKCYRYGLTLTGGEPLGIGTDVNGFFPLPAPPLQMPNGPFYPLETITYGASISQCITGARVWNFNSDGMAHYGMFPDFIESCRKVGMTTAEQKAFFSSAERFAKMWEKCDVSKANVY